METISSKVFEAETVTMDDRHFVDCLFVGCTLRYSCRPVDLETTEFKGCAFQFGEGAALTVRFLECFGLVTRQVTLPAEPLYLT